jgi:hypothetical protein
MESSLFGEKEKAVIRWGELVSKNEARYDSATFKTLSKYFDAQEIVELSQYIEPLSNTGANFYVAAVQDPTATTANGGWLLGNDVAVPAEVWLTGQPDDADGAENHAENVAYFDKTPSVQRMRDNYGGLKAGSVCECDGTPLGAMHQQYVDADPNNPN